MLRDAPSGAYRETLKGGARLRGAKIEKKYYFLQNAQKGRGGAKDRTPPIYAYANIDIKATIIVVVGNTNVWWDKYIDSSEIYNQENNNSKRKKSKRKYNDR